MDSSSTNVLDPRIPPQKEEWWKTARLEDACDYAIIACFHRAHHSALRSCARRVADVTAFTGDHPDLLSLGQAVRTPHAGHLDPRQKSTYDKSTVEIRQSGRTLLTAPELELAQCLELAMVWEDKEKSGKSLLCMRLRVTGRESESS